MTAARAVLAIALALQTLRGLRLEEAISVLQREGLTIIYSSALVKPEMRVLREPRAAAPREKLQEILAEHGLQIQEGPHHQLLVVAMPSPPRPAPPLPRPVFSDEIVVMPSFTRLLNDPPASRESMSREEIDRLPNPVGDVARAVQSLPGVASNEISASVNIRGGAAGDTAIAIDGLELSEPFHLKDFLNLFSTLDSDAVARVDLMTGAFPAEWGDRMAGVMDVSLQTPNAPQSTSVTLGTLNARVSSTGSIGDGDTTWLVAARGWYPDLVLSADRDGSEAINIDCYDLLGKLEHRFTDRTSASLTFLGAYDNLGYRNAKADETDRSVAEESSAHVWLTARTDWSERTSVRTILAVGTISRDRSGSIAGPDHLVLDDGRGFDFVELKQDWRAASAGLHQWKLGFDAKTSDARYDYVRAGGDTPPVASHLRPHDQTLGLYLSDRIRLGDSAVAEVGVRWDRQKLTESSQLSPRLNLLWSVSSATDLRLGWGRYFQSQRLNELQIEDGVTRFSLPELAEQRTASVEHRFANGVALRVEGFDKPMTRVRPRFENQLNPMDLFVEAQEDRVMVAPSRSRASGVELRLAGSAGARSAWWLSYARTRAVDVIDGRNVPRSWDQPHAAGGGFHVVFGAGWKATLAASWHTGWPTTPTDAVRTADGLSVIDGPRNSARLPPWFRLDGRVSKAISSRRGELEVSLDVLNLTNHENVCCIRDVVPFANPDGTLGVVREERAPLPIFPSISVRWNF